MASITNSQDSEGSHFTGRPPPPYHLVDVTKQFSFNYGSYSSKPTPEEPVQPAQQDHPKQRSDLFPLDEDQETSGNSLVDGLERAVPILPLNLLSDDFKIANLPIISRPREHAWRSTSDQDTASSLSFSEDGGCILPPSSTSGSTDPNPYGLIPQCNLSLRRKPVSPSTARQQAEAGRVFRNSSAIAPGRPRVEATHVNRALTATTNHLQYASYRRGYERNRNAIAEKEIPPLPVRPMNWQSSGLADSDFDKCSEPWALSALGTWLIEESDLPWYSTKSRIIVALRDLFAHKANAGRFVLNPILLSHRIFESLLNGGTIADYMGFYYFTPVITIGVLLEVAGGGCYSVRAHERMGDEFGMCYSSRCRSKDDFEKAMRFWGTPDESNEGTLEAHATDNPFPVW